MHREARLLYDVDCGFCRWSLAKILAWDRHERLRPVAIQSPEGARLLADLSPEQRLASWHLVQPDGSRASAGAGLAPLLRLLPGGTPIAWLTERLPGLSERGYRFVAGRRGTLGPLIRPGAAARAEARIRRRRG